MEGKPQDEMTVGIIHFMAYPAVMKGRGPIVETLTEIAEDDYFQAVEVTTAKRPKVRHQAIELLKKKGLKVAFGIQPMLLGGKLDLNALDGEAREKALDTAKAGIDEAMEWGAVGAAVLSGPDPGEEDRDDAKQFLVGSLKELCEYSRTKDGPPVLLESFDRVDFGKNCLIGPTKEAVQIADAVASYYPRFGLLLDLSHLPLLRETAEGMLVTAREYLRHVHVGNCVMREPDHPAYGDNHPMFGIAEGENGVEELAEFLRVLREIDYIGPGKRNIVSFEVKPFGDQTSQDVLANAKDTLDAAWAQL